MKTKDTITLRADRLTQQKLKIVAALSHESMLATLARLVSQEFDRLQKGVTVESTEKGS